MKDSLDTWLSLDFWRARLQETVVWAIEAVPKLLVLTLLAMAALKLYRLVLKRLQARLLLERGEDQDAALFSEQKKRVTTLIGIAQKVGVVTIWTLLGLLVLVQLGIDVGPLIAGAGVIGLAIGFGAQELVRDVISGFFMLLENHIRTGDVATINGTSGSVENIGLRTVSLRDLSGVVHVFQNGKIDTVANMTKDWSAIVFEIGVAYKEDTDEVSEVVKQVAQELRSDSAYADKIIEPLELFGVDSLGDSAVVLKARYKTRPGEQWNVGREYNRRIKKAFDAQNIEIPFPHRTLCFSDASPAFKLSVDPNKSNGSMREHLANPS